jgi:hypothetical protein
MGHLRICQRAKLGVDIEAALFLSLYSRSKTARIVIADLKKRQPRRDVFLATDRNRGASHILHLKNFSDCRTKSAKGSPLTDTKKVVSEASALPGDFDPGSGERPAGARILDRIRGFVS